MDYPFRLKGGRTFLVRGWGNFPVELAAMLAGVKPAAHCCLKEDEAGYLDELVAAFGLRRADIPPGPGAAPGWIEVMVGPRAGPVRRAAEVWSRRVDNPGIALGYPPCCVRRYTRWVRDKGPEGSAHSDIVRRIHKYTKPARSWPFLLNNVFYCYSRYWKPGDSRRREALERLNPGLDLGMLNILPWHPCAYDCPIGLAKAESAWKTMRSRIPGHAALLESILARPIVFWDWDRFAVLEGVSAGAAASYRTLGTPASALNPPDSRLLRDGDRVASENEGVAVFRGQKRLGGLSRGALILPFGPKL